MKRSIGVALLGLWFLVGLLMFYDLPRQEEHLAALKIRVEALEVDNVKLAQNDSTLAEVINALHRRIRALEADTLRGRKK